MANDIAKLCECGCGQLTPIATENNATVGYVRGERMRFVQYHHAQRTLEEAFWECAIAGEPGECWEWQGQRQSANYGRLSYRSQRIYVHRASYELHHGPIPDGLKVLHKCDNPPCWNPDHLFLGTDGDNTLDKVAKGRQAFGARAGGAKLNDATIVEIRLLATESISNTEIARRVGVNPTTIWNVVNKQTWRHVE